MSFFLSQSHIRVVQLDSCESHERDSVALVEQLHSVCRVDGLFTQGTVGIMCGSWKTVTGCIREECKEAQRMQKVCSSLLWGFYYIKKEKRGHMMVVCWNDPHRSVPDTHAGLFGFTCSVWTRFLSRFWLFDVEEFSFWCNQSLADLHICHGLLLYRNRFLLSCWVFVFIENFHWRKASLMLLSPCFLCFSVYGALVEIWCFFALITFCGHKI